MRFLAWLIVGVWLVSAPALANNLTLLGVGGRSGPAAASYVGPGDVVALSFWAGMRAYSAATRGQAAVNICSESAGVDVTCEDELTSATTGKLVLGTVGSTCGSVTCTIKTWYDQTGNNFCSGPCNFSDSTVANRPTFNINCPTINYPCAQFVGSNDWFTIGAGPTPSSFAIHSYSVVLQYTNTGSTESVLLDDNNNQISVAASGSPMVSIYDGVFFTAPASAGAWHSIQVACGGSVTNASALYVDGAATAGTLSGTHLRGRYQMGSAFGSQNLTAYITEVGIVDDLTFNGTQGANLTTNQRSFYDF